MSPDGIGRPVELLAAVSGLVFSALPALSALAARRRERRTRLRADRLLGRERARLRWRPAWRVWARSWGPPLGAFTGGCVLVGGLPGCAMGVVAGCAVHLWRRHRPPGARAEETAAAHRLPLAADLLAACVSAGAGPREAAEAVGESLGGPVGEQLVRTAAELRLGGEPDRAWGTFARIPGAGELARCLSRADATGAPAAEPVARQAERLRAARARAATARARRAQVLVTAPVGLCFLPAFLAVGVAPVAIGLASGLLDRA
ncbi:type II secretion system F family protein [Streptomyces qinzhouensis]|uniref:type II secretion system F family protein n=1 Tax=Streptomyces qinzhouensis TaxID=2599401 RepID=UPI001FE3004B|nr:type II secretion system F family protein [Streptomyces qinzhouensis]